MNARLLVCSMMLTAGVAAHAATIHVNARGTGGDGKSWSGAVRTVEDALKQAGNGDEIWVASGSYKLSGRAATFQLKPGVALYGGFAGNETRLDQRDWQKNATTLDGGGEASHVVTGADNAVLDGFTVTGGNAMTGGPGGAGAGGAPGIAGGMGGGQRRGAFAGGGGTGGGEAGGGGRPIHTTPQAVMGGSGAGCGAGMLNFRASPTVRNCVFEKNKAGKGGAVYNMTSTSFPPRMDGGEGGKAPVFVNCVFRNNSAFGRGGGVSNDMGTSPTFLNCVFEANETPQKGGGMYNDFGCSPTLVNCLFTGNQAESAAGMGNDGGSSPVLYFCTFTKNHAKEYGAPLYQGTGPASNPALVACVVSGNLCDWEDPGIYNWHDCTPLVKESATGDAGYKPGRFTEAQLPRLLADLRQYQAKPVREEAPAPEAAIPSSARIVYVNAAANAGGDGRAWTSAFRDLGAALADAGKDGAEVRVAAGTYKPGADRAASFALRPGVRVLGGFAGRGDERDIAKNRTVLDGNRAYHVVVGANGAVLDGLSITNGFADGAGYDGKGGGLIAYRRAPQGRPNSEVVTGFAMEIRNCIFSNNYARDGGAVYSYDRAKPVFTGCLFAGNRAENGGAVLDRVGVTSSFENCEFAGNTARWRGGALYFDSGSRPGLKSCVFRGNTAGAHGGGVFSASRASQLENTVVTLDGCRFEGNVAKGDGGAAAFCDSSVSSVKNCAFTGNQAGRTGNDAYTDTSSSNAAAAPSSAAAGATGGRPASSGGAASGRGGRTAEGGNTAAQFQPAADFSVVIIGSGSPQYNPQRSGPSAAIQYHGRFFLVDMGNGTQARLYEAGISAAQIDALVLTHHHRDHDEEFMPLLATALVRGTPPEVVGPPGTKKLADFTAEFYAEDIAYRMERMGRSAANLRKPEVRELQGGESFKLGDVQIKTAQVPHSIHTVAYRFDASGQSIVISGDLTYSDKLVELARGADVLVLDSGASIVRPGAAAAAGTGAGAGSGTGAGRAGGGGRTGEGRQTAMAHPSAQDVANMAQKAGVKTLVLTHITATEVDEEATANAIRETYKGTVIVGHDLLQVAPAGSAPATPAAAAPAASGRQPAGRSATRFIQRLDKDGDGKVSKAEFDGPAERFNDFDKNGDGFITGDEAPTGPATGRGGVRGGGQQPGSAP